MIVSFVYCWFVEKCAGCLVWLGIAAALFSGVVLSYSLLRAAQDYKSDPAFNDRYKAVMGLGIISSVCTAAFFIVVIALRDRIRWTLALRIQSFALLRLTQRSHSIAIAVIEDAALALQDMRSLILFPFLLVLLGKWLRSP